MQISTQSLGIACDHYQPNSNCYCLEAKRVSKLEMARENVIIPKVEEFCEFRF